MSHELSVFLIAAGLTALVGGVIRMLVLKNNEALLRLEIVDFGRDFITAAAAVVPTTLLLQVDPHKRISIDGYQALAIFGTALMLFIWGFGESRYLSDWRKGERGTGSPTER